MAGGRGSRLGHATPGLHCRRLLPLMVWLGPQRPPCFFHTAECSLDVSLPGPWSSRSVGEAGGGCGAAQTVRHAPARTMWLQGGGCRRPGRAFAGPQGTATFGGKLFEHKVLREVFLSFFMKNTEFCGSLYSPWHTAQIFHMCAPTASSPGRSIPRPVLGPSFSGAPVRPVPGLLVTAGVLRRVNTHLLPCWLAFRPSA